MRHSYLSVLGKPFFSIGGQVHNSSAYPIGRKGNPQYEEDSERSFESVKAIGGNTIAVPICWDAFELEEGAYNAGYVHTVIDNIRSALVRNLEKRADGIYAVLGKKGSGTFSPGAL